MSGRERKRRHDDAHRPMTGKGKRGWRVPKDQYPVCKECGVRRPNPHLCPGLPRTALRDTGGERG
jgi:hypothetical protein